MAGKWPAQLYELRENWLRLILSLFIGLIGAQIFVYLRLPLPWMIGPLFFTTATSLAGVKIWVPLWIKTPMFLVIGVMFGTTVSPELISQFTKWLPSMIGVVVYLVIVMPPIVFYLLKIAKYDFVTSYFSASPGGVVAMMVMGGAMGGDERKISLIQSARLILTVLTIPIAFRLFAGYEPSGMVGTGGSFQDLNLLDSVTLIAVALLGYSVARPIKLPAPLLTGPMISIGILSVSGFSEAEVPDVLVAIAQLVIGASIGTMFNGVKVKEVASVLMHGFTAASIMVIFACLFAWLLQILTAQPIKPLILAFGPGGFTEMALVGFGLGIEAAFVVAHQMVRYVLLVAFVPVSYSFVKKWMDRDQ